MAEDDCRSDSELEEVDVSDAEAGLSEDASSEEEEASESEADDESLTGRGSDES